MVAGKLLEKNSCFLVRALETFRVEDKDNYEYEIWLKVFLCILKIETPQKASFTIFITRKVSTVTFGEGGYTLYRSQNDKTSNTW